MKLPAYVASSDSVHTVKYICTLREFLRLAMKVWTSPHSYTQMYLYIASIMFNVSNSHEGRTFFGGISIEEMAKDKDLQKEMLTRQQLIQLYYDTHWGDGSWETRRSYIAKIKLNFQQNYLPENRSNLKKDGKESNLAYHAKVLQMRKEDPPGRASQTAEIMMIRPRRRQPPPCFEWTDPHDYFFFGVKPCWRANNTNLAPQIQNVERIWGFGFDRRTGLPRLVDFKIKKSRQLKDANVSLYIYDKLGRLTEKVFGHEPGFLNICIWDAQGDFINNYLRIRKELYEVPSPNFGKQ